VSRVQAHLRVPRSTLGAFEEAGWSDGGPGDGLVFWTDPEVGEDWEAVQAELMEAFRLTQAAARASAPVVYVVRQADLLGQRGAGPAMAACGLLSAARTAAIEGLRSGGTVNVLAVDEDTPPQLVAAWALRLCQPDAPTGELVRLGPSHLGKALP
jgi:hypothetical protein